MWFVSNVGRRWMGQVAMMVAVMCSMSGCTMKMGMYFPNDRFAYPNSNVEPLGHVTGWASESGWFSAPMVDKKLMDAAISDALKQKGGDMLINYKMTTSVTMIPIPIVSYFITELKVDGTAAKMTIGKQELR